ncbi:MAG: methane monooxygenase/ammonia monooxygenase subunit B [Actinomycetota bacterium]
MNLFSSTTEIPNHLFGPKRSKTSWKRSAIVKPLLRHYTRLQAQGLAGVKAMVSKTFTAYVTGTVSTSDQKQKALALVREEKSLTQVVDNINVPPTVGEAANKQADEERRAADAAHDFLPTEGKERGASLEKAVDKVHQEAIMRLRTIFWYDIRWSNDVFNVNDKGTIWGKFHVFEGWPETMAQPDAAFLNIDIEEMDSRDPAFVIQEAYIGGQPAFNIPASYIVGQLVPRPRPVRLKTGADYTFKVVLKARLPGKWRVRPTISVEGSSPVTSPGIQLTVEGPIYSFNYDALPVLDMGPVHSKPMKERPSPINVAVDDATYDVPRSTMHMKLTVTNKGNRPVQLSEFNVAAIRFWNDSVRSRWELSERRIYGGYKEKGKEGELEVTFNDDPILPGHARTQKVMAISSAWEASALWEVIGSSNNRFAGMLFFTSGDDREKVVIDAPLGRTPTTRPAVPFAALGTKALPTEVADIPDLRVGDTYLVDSQYPNNAKLNNMTERKVVSVIDGGVTVASRNVKSRSGQSRMLRYTQEWNLVSSRNADGSGLDYSPPLKYFEFPLYPGKSWRQTSRETNVKTGATRDFTLSATVGEWENISVPAGTFRAIKITTQSEIVDSVSGQRSTGTDVSWYAPDIRRSVRSVITSRNMQGDVEDQLIHVTQYQVSSPSSAQQSSVSQEIPNVQLPDTSKENLQEEAQVLSLAEEQVLKVKRRAEASVPPKQGNQKAARAASDRGSAYLQSGQISEAIGALQEAHRADPADVYIVRNLSNAYLQNNDLNSAEDYMLTALALEPEWAMTWHLLGGIYDKKGEIPAAAASFTNAYRFSKDQDHTHRQFLRDLDLDIDVNRKRAVRLATQVIEGKLLRQTAAARGAERKASEREAGSRPTVEGAGATTWAQPKTMTLDELDKFPEEYVKAYGAVAPLDNERESRKLSRTPEAYEGKVVALGGQLDRRVTEMEFAHRGSLFFFVQPAIGLTFHARGVVPKSKALEFDDSFLLIGLWERGKQAVPALSQNTWGINIYLICGVVVYEKSKEAEVLCETLKKP